MNNKLRMMYPDADPILFGLQDNSDGNGIFIGSWQQPFPQPTQSELDAVADADVQDWLDIKNIRVERVPLLVEADVLINKAYDLDQDTTLLKEYRQALRDWTITKVKPVKP